MNYSNSQRGGVILYFTALLFGAYDEHQEYGLYRYNDILFENGIEWDNASMREVDTSALDGKCITALLMGAIRADRFSEGALLHFFEAGTITKWLNRLKEIDEKKSLD